MRALVIFCILALACTGAALAANDAGTTGTCPAPTVSPTDQMMDMCLMNSCNIGNAQLVQLRSQGLTNSDIATACAISSRANVSVNAVVSDYMSCSKDWSAVAKKYNLSLSDLTSAASLGSSDMEAFNSAFISQYYGVSQTDLMRLRQQGYSWPDINMMANAAVRTNCTIMGIATLRSQGMTWDEIAAKYNIPAGDLTRPVVAKTVTSARVGAGPTISAPINIYDKNGNILLTEEDAMRLYAKGNDWLDVAVATNIARETGYTVPQVLQQLHTGATWDTIAMNYGVAPNVAFNICGYPFCKRSIYSASMEESNVRRVSSYVNCDACPAPNPSYTEGPAKCRDICPSACPAPCPEPCPAACPAPCPAPAPACPGAGPACPEPCPAPCPAPAPACPAPAPAPCPGACQ